MMLCSSALHVETRVAVATASCLITHDGALGQVTTTRVDAHTFCWQVGSSRAA